VTCITGETRTSSKKADHTRSSDLIRSLFWHTHRLMPVNGGICGRMASYTTAFSTQESRPACISEPFPTGIRGSESMRSVVMQQRALEENAIPHLVPACHRGIRASTILRSGHFTQTSCHGGDSENVGWRALSSQVRSHPIEGPPQSHRQKQHTG